MTVTAFVRYVRARMRYGAKMSKREGAAFLQELLKQQARLTAGPTTNNQPENSEEEHIIMKVPDSGNGFQLCPEGAHMAVVKEIVDEGISTNQFTGKPQRRAKIVWQASVNGAVIEVFDWMTLSKHKDSTMYACAKALLGGVPESLDTDDMVGRTCMIVVVHKTSDGLKKHKIQSYLPVAKPEVPATPKAEPAPPAAKSTRRARGEIVSAQALGTTTVRYDPTKGRAKGVPF